jgi:hypothetical protein
MWNLVSVRLETILVSMQDWCMVCANVRQAQKSFWTHTMELLGDVGHVESRSGPFGDSFNFDTSWCTVCDKCAISLEIILDAPNSSPR